MMEPRRSAATPDTLPADWHPTACILCECNCGVEVRLGGPDGRRFERIRGDKAHPASHGYTCEKALRLDHYQNGRHRLTSPMRRRPDGSYQPVDWETAIAEVASRFARVRDRYGGAAIFYYGGGGQGNHLNGSYSSATRAVSGSKYRSNALAQEKTGEFWVNGKILGGYVRGDIEQAEVAVFIGKNPWQSHSFPRARTTLKEIARDPKRSMVVVDPRRTETAEFADYHLALWPGTDAWCLAALAAVIVQEELLDRRWLEEHTVGLAVLEPVLAAIDVDAFAGICDVEPALIRRTARRIAAASSVAVFEDLGVQMNLHSTLCSYLDKLLWLLTGNFANPGGQYIPTSIVALTAGGSGPRPAAEGRSPVANALINGLTFSVDDPADSWARVRTTGGLLNLQIDVLVTGLADLASTGPAIVDPDFPLVLTAGERRAFTANTIFRDPGWRKRDADGALHISKADANALGLADGDTALLTTKRGSVPVMVEISPMIRPGHVALPNGFGLRHTPDDNVVGVAPNELTTSDHRDPIAGTPYHKHVPARLEPFVFAGPGASR